MSIAESYIRATKSSHLEVKTDEACDMDLLIAAGMVGHKCHVGRESLGVMLFRVRAEFDRVMIDLRMAKAEFRAQDELAQLWTRIHASEILPPTRARCRELADTEPKIMRQAAERAALTTRALILVQLGSLEPVARAVASYAVDSAIRGSLGSTDASVRRIAGQVLDVFLDITCPACEGRSFTGGYGRPQVLCPTCRATGKRSPSFGATAAEHDFGRWLLDDLSAKMHEAERLMRSKLRQR